MISKIKDIQDTFNCDEKRAKEIKKIIADIADDRIENHEDELEIPF
mgnify:FL=1